MTERLSPDKARIGNLKRFYRGKEVLVTGGASFIGSHLCELLVDLGARVTVIDNLSSGKLSHLSAIRNSIGFQKADLRRDGVAAAAMKGRRIVFHLAAAHGGRGYIESHPVECLNNMLLDHLVFTAAADAGAEKIVYASSACAYPVNLQGRAGGRRRLKESDANCEEPGKAFPDGEYGWSKLMGELQLRAVHKKTGVSGVACRLFAVYGERANASHAVIALIAKAAARMDPFPIWGDGRQTRNFTYVRDTVLGLALAGAKIEGFQTVNVGTSRYSTVLELIDEIFNAFGWRPKTIMKELGRPVGVKSRAADNSRSRKILHWSAQHPLSDGIRRTAAWYVAEAGRARPPHERALMERA